MVRESKIQDIYCNNYFEISLVVFTPNITTNHAITYTDAVKGVCVTYRKS